MRLDRDRLLLSPSDLSNFFSCRHRAGLELAVALKQLSRPRDDDPYLDALRRRGAEHEHDYVQSLRASGRDVLDLKQAANAAERTRDAIVGGADVIVQAYLVGGGLHGYADVLLRVDEPSDLGPWSYEPQDTKLARETKGGTILQLSAYSALLRDVQGRLPSRFHVITPGAGGGFVMEAYQTAEYAAFYRMVLATLERELAGGPETMTAAHYPEPVEACAVCLWEARCNGRRRADDHLSFVAGAARSQRVELVARGYDTLARAAAMPVPVTFTPSRGARETYDRLGHQARVQHEQRTTRRPVIEQLPIHGARGLCRLPVPSPGDLFLDLEGAPFARDGGREYLFGVWSAAGYQAWWAFDDRDEQAAFEAVVDLIMQTWAADPRMHVYHFNHYEPTAFKKLMGRYVTRATELDQLLRAERFVDLYPVVRQSVRAGVESYSIKQLEQYTGYGRRMRLEDVRGPLLAVEAALDVQTPGAIADVVREAVQAYNEDDCRSTASLRDWLETIRDGVEASGTAVPRPLVADTPDENAVSPIQESALAVRARILSALSAAASDPGHADHPTWLLAYLVDWHRREVNAEWWEYFRIRDLSDEELLDEPKAVMGLEFVCRIDAVRNAKTGKPTGSVIDRYRYRIQDIEIGRKSKLKLQDGRSFGEVVLHDRVERTVDVKKGPAMADTHPSCAFAADVVTTDGLQASMIRFAERVLSESDECGAQLLFRKPPRTRSGRFAPRGDESAQDFAIRLSTDLDRTTLAIQGPPGAGKTFIGAQMIRSLVSAGKRVGVAAISHKVIRNLLDEVVAQATAARETVRVGAKVTELNADAGAIREFKDNPDALDALTDGTLHVLGGTSFLWSRPEFGHTVDVLFVDEAGQMSLANVLAISEATDSLVLLGDPQQLEQPQKATHPDGVGISALQHVLGSHETMPAERGIFLPVTWRMSPALTEFTSEMFYEGKLRSSPSLSAQALAGTGAFDGSALWAICVSHDGNQSASPEEVDAVDSLVQDLLTPGAQWMDEEGLARPLTAGDLRVVAPFNAQVNRLAERLGPRGIPVGTVDKFQGQTAAVVIYSMATSRPEDAPRGMEFLYSLNRLNVATSRARCAVFLVASPHLFEPHCRTPTQMKLANALCRYRELARVV